LSGAIKELFLDGNNMTKVDWLPYLKDTLDKKTAQHLALLASANVNALKYLIDMSFHHDRQIAFRAAWVLECAFNLSKDCFIVCLPDFLSAYPKQNNNSCRRHYTKILMGFSERRSGYLDQYELSELVEATFEWLIDPDTPVAVKVNCLDVLFNLSNRYDWLIDELKAQIVFLLKDGTAAMQSRGKSLLNKMKRLSI
jgi:hypothetical protein